MMKRVEAIYENGVLKLMTPLSLPDQTRVLATIETNLAVGEDPDRGLWLKTSEQTLAKVWDNPADDIFNELL